jgi:hypothetical protein
MTAFQHLMQSDVTKGQFNQLFDYSVFACGCNSVTSGQQFYPIAHFLTKAAASV